MKPYLASGAEATLFLLLALLPFLIANSYAFALLTLLAIYGILLIGLDISVGYLGQINLAQAAFLGLGAYAAGISVSFLGAGLIPSLFISTLTGLLFGALLAYPALRLEGPQFALSTLSFSALTATILNELESLTGGAQGLSVSRPHLWNWGLDPRGFYWLSLFLLFLVWMSMKNLLASHWGRSFEAVRDSPIATDAMGVGTMRFKVTAFAFGSGLGGLAGGLYAFNFQFLQPTSFGYDLMVILLLGVVLGGRKSLWGAFVGATVIVLLPNLLSDHLFFKVFSASGLLLALAVGFQRLKRGESNTLQAIAPILSMGILVIGGIFIRNTEDWRRAIFALILFSVVVGLPEGLMGFAKRFISNLFRLPPQALPDASRLDQMLFKQPESGVLLEIIQLKRYFGGVKAVDGVSLKIQSRAVHGLIGPNGSGKSTLVNLISGIYAPTSGEILFRERALPKGSLITIARIGISRTFQTPQLFSELTALENVLVALKDAYKVPLLLLLLGFARSEERKASAAALAFLELVGLYHLAGLKAKELPYGSQRFLEIARALSRNPDLLILDEPAAGLTRPDLKKLVEIIKLIHQFGITIILIEHHMEVVNELCDIVTVLDEGKVIAEGKTEEIRRDPKVIEAYLGNSAVPTAQVGQSLDETLPVLTLRNICGGYGRSEVLQGISLVLRKGSIVALIGANGAGKTTTLRIISGTIVPTRGSVLLGTREIGGLPPATISRLGVAHSPEGRHVFGSLSVEDNLLLGSYHSLPKWVGFRKKGRKDLEMIYELFPKLKGRRNQLSGTLSGGEQQMLALGRALMAKPMAILLDEPSMGLAPALVQELFEIIGRLKEGGVTLLLVEQFAKRALQVADYAYVLEQGKISFEGRPDELSNNSRILSAYLG